jgi:hypothetical protein
MQDDDDRSCPVYFHGTPDEARKHFKARMPRYLICRWKTGRDRMRYFLRLTGLQILCILLVFSVLTIGIAVFHATQKPVFGPVFLP